MAKIYYNLITAEMWKLEDVPMRWKEDVVKLLEADKEEGSPTPPVEESPSPEPEEPVEDTPPADQEPPAEGNITE